MGHPGRDIDRIRQTGIGIDRSGGDDRIGGIDLELGDLRIRAEIMGMIGRSLAGNGGGQSGHGRLIRDLLVGIDGGIFDSQRSDSFGFQGGYAVMFSGCDAVENPAQDGILDRCDVGQGGNSAPFVERGVAGGGDQTSPYSDISHVQFSSM